MKQFASWFTHGVPGGGALRKQIFEAKNGGVVLDSVERFFEERANEVASDVASGVDLREDDLMTAAAAYCD